jgi:hypothetical protein
MWSGASVEVTAPTRRQTPSAISPVARSHRFVSQRLSNLQRSTMPPWIACQNVTRLFHRLGNWGEPRRCESTTARGEGSMLGGANRLAVSDRIWADPNKPSILRQSTSRTLWRPPAAGISHRQRHLLNSRSRLNGVEHKNIRTRLRELDRGNFCLRKVHACPHRVQQPKL